MNKSCSLNLDRNLDRKTSIEVYSRSSTQTVSVETYEIITFRYDFRPMLKYLYSVSFLTTLDIYKIYFKDRYTWRTHAESDLVHYSLWRIYCVFTPRVLWPRSFLIFIVDELKNFAANNLFKLLELVMYWDPCILVSHILGFVHQGKNYRYNTSPIGYWGKGSTVSYFGIGQRVW